jgi:hypothetical protein
VWRDGSGRIAIERFDINGMGHGTPLATRGEANCGMAGAHMLEAGICSTSRIAGFWGLIGKQADQNRAAATAPGKVSPLAKPQPRPAATPPRASGVGAVIEDALRAAGLMR